MADKDKPQVVGSLVSGWVRISRDNGVSTHDCPLEAWENTYSTKDAGWKIVGVAPEDAEEYGVEETKDDAATPRASKAKEA